MTVVVDSSVLVDHLRGFEPARRRLASAASSGEYLVASVLTRTEVRAGVRAGDDDAITELFRAFGWVAVDDDVADRAGALAEFHRRAHPGIDTVDYVIAATAQRMNADLWTRNVRHFPMFAGLAPPY